MLAPHKGVDGKVTDRLGLRSAARVGEEVSQARVLHPGGIFQGWDVDGDGYLPRRGVEDVLGGVDDGGSVHCWV